MAAAVFGGAREAARAFLGVWEHQFPNPGRVQWPWRVYVELCTELKKLGSPAQEGWWHSTIELCHCLVPSPPSGLPLSLATLSNQFHHFPPFCSSHYPAGILICQQSSWASCQCWGPASRGTGLMVMGKFHQQEGALWHFCDTQHRHCKCSSGVGQHRSFSALGYYNPWMTLIFPLCIPNRLKYLRDQY